MTNDGSYTWSTTWSCWRSWCIKWVKVHWLRIWLWLFLLRPWSCGWPWRTFWLTTMCTDKNQIKWNQLYQIQVVICSKDQIDVWNYGISSSDKVEIILSPSLWMLFTNIMWMKILKKIFVPRKLCKLFLCQPKPLDACLFRSWNRNGGCTVSKIMRFWCSCCVGPF